MSVIALDNYISVCLGIEHMTNIEITNTADTQVIGYLERQMHMLHNEIQALTYQMEARIDASKNDLETIRQLKVHYTSLLNTALAYENFDLDDFESCLS